MVVRRLVSALLALCCVLAGAAAPASTATAATDELALSDEAKRDLMLDVIERFVPHAQSFHRPSDLAEPRSDYFDASGPGVTQPRGAGNIAIAYATLLTARPDQAEFAGVARETMLEATVQSIRHEALTSVLSGAGYDRWGGGQWQSSLETYGWGWAARLLWDHLDDDTRALVERVVVGEADILLTKPVATGVDGNTGAEDNAWNSPTPALAAVMFPGHPHRAGWEEAAIKLALNASSAPADEQSGELVDGRALGEWMESVNIHPDLTMENHGFFNPIYQQVTHVNIGEAAAIYAGADHPVPEAFSFRTEEIWERVLGPLASDDGDLVMPAGQDWTSKDYQHLDYLTVLATRFGRADASVAESRALELVAQRQATHDTGAILGQPDLGYESMLVKRLTAAWWNHQLFGPSPQPTQEEYDAARAETAGVRHFEHVESIQAGQRDAFTSMSWSLPRPTGLVVPAATGHPDDPIFTAYTPGSLVGDAAGAVGPYSCDCAEDYFSTAGTIGPRAFSMTSFPDGMVMLLDRGTGSTFTVGLEHIPGLADERPVHSEGGEGIGELAGTWVNAADRLGLVVAGGGGLRVRDVAAANPYRLIEGSMGTGSGNRGAAVYPLVDHQTTAELAGGLVQPDTPEGWSALLADATDGTRRLAVARWSGAETASLDLVDDRGGPLTTWPGSVTGTTATVAAGLGLPASKGEVVRWFATTSGQLTTGADADGRPVLTNDGADPVTVTATYVGDDGSEAVVTREVFAGEQVTPRLVDGVPVLAGPEYESLATVHGVLLELAAQVERWRADGTLDAAAALALRTRVRVVDGIVGQALDASAAHAPNTARIDTLTRAAHAAANQLRAPDGPAEVRERVDADRAEVIAGLDTTAATLGVTARISSIGVARPGETLPLAITLTHRGLPGAADGTLTLELPDGWSAQPERTRVPLLAPGSAQVIDHQVSVPADATPGEVVALAAAFDYRWAGAERSARVSTDLTVRPVVIVDAVEQDLPLAAGGWNRTEVVIGNEGTRALPVTLDLVVPDGVSAEATTTAVVVEPGSETVVGIEVRNAALVAGTGDLVVEASADDLTGVGATTTVGLHYSSDLALNGLGARWPAATADTHQAAYPPGLVNDGDPATFWVSEGTAPGDGPTPEGPIAWAVDLGAPAEFGTVTMTPRPQYGPRTYRIEVSDDGSDWRPVADVTAPATGVTTTALEEPVTARHVRLVITGSWDRVQPPRNVQVAGLSISRQ